MSLTQIRNRIQALQRRYALALTVIRLRPFATEFCEQWAVARANHEPIPQSHTFIKNIADAGFRLPTYTALKKYVDKPYPVNYPEPRGIIAALLPHAAARRVIDAVLRWDPIPDSVPSAPPPTSPTPIIGKT